MFLNPEFVLTCKNPECCGYEEFYSHHLNSSERKKECPLCNDYMEYSTRETVKSERKKKRQARDKV